MGKIRILPEEIISKIAAGEIIERPAYALKELLENAIDAGANDLKIEIEENGLGKIAIYDNGEGMDEDDLNLCFLPHATSKIEDENLTRIKTLGFRGEALAAIAAVSDLKIISRKASSITGNQIEISFGKKINSFPVGGPVGTVVIVQNLFARIPARKKFLKGEKTEFRYLLEIINQFALAYPEIRFEVYHNKKVLFDLPKKQKGSERIKLLLGLNIFENLIPMSYAESYLKIAGFLCKPQVYSSNTLRQYFFVNGRRIFANLISTAVREAFGRLLEPGSQPVFVLFLEIPPEMVDINIHPRKEQAAFPDTQFIYNAFQKAVTETLVNHNLTFCNLNWQQENLSGKTNSYLGKLLKEEVLPSEDQAIGQINLSAGVMQIHNLYLLCQTRQGIALLDQHAAHERILFTEFSLAYLKHKKKKKVFHLPQAILLELSVTEKQTLLEHLATFTEMGFSLESFGDNVFKIETVPLIFKDWEISTIIRETLEDLAQSNQVNEIDRQSRKMITYLACRSAIKAGDKLTKKQAKDLITKLANLDLAYTCPHGRPLKVEIPLSQIDKMFRR